MYDEISQLYFAKDWLNSRKIELKIFKTFWNLTQPNDALLPEGQNLDFLLFLLLLFRKVGPYSVSRSTIWLT